MKKNIMVLVALLSFGCYAEDSSISDNISQEFTVCAAYFTVVSLALESSEKLELSEKYSQVAQDLLVGAVGFANQGRTEEMSENVVMSRLSLHTDNMLKEIGGKSKNISILMNKHLKRCSSAVESPEGFVKSIVKDNENEKN